MSYAGYHAERRRKMWEALRASQSAAPVTEPDYDFVLRIRRPPVVDLVKDPEDGKWRDRLPWQTTWYRVHCGELSPIKNAP